MRAVLLASCLGLSVLGVVPAQAKMQPIVEGGGAAAAPAILAPAIPKAMQASVNANPAPLFGRSTAFKQVLLDVLEQTVRTNPALSVSEQSVALAQEAVTYARTGYKPSVALDASVSTVFTDSDPGNSKTRTPLGVGVSATQPLFNGGRTTASVTQAERKLAAAKLVHEATKQQTLNGAATALFDLAKAQAIKALNQNNIMVLERRFQSTERTFEVGELTRTDVAQAKARLEGSRAALLAAEANEAEALERLKRISGLNVAGMTVALPDPAELDQTVSLFAALPASSDEAAKQASTNNPLVQAAAFDIQAASAAIKIAQSARAPQIDAVAAATQTWKPASSATLDQARNASLGVTATLPLYTGGKTQSTIRSAVIAEAQSKDSLVDIAALKAQQAKVAWEQNRAARAQITALEAQVAADAQARAGTYREREVGTRTILDTLDADQALLSSQTSLVSAVRDVLVTRFSTLEATGQLALETAAKVELPAVVAPQPAPTETALPLNPAGPALVVEPLQPKVAAPYVAPVRLSVPERYTLTPAKK